MHLLLLSLLLVYGAIAGLRSVADFDLGWQMADARHPWSSVDTLSYTAPGVPWIYPPLAGIVFRALFELGGYVAISWFCTLALVATLAIVGVGSRRATLVLLLVATPILEAQMIPRSGLFSVVIAAAYTRLLLSHYKEKNCRLWLLPLLMVFWVNLHTGFIAGLGLMLGYVGAELVDCFRGHARTAALAKLRRAAPWLAAGFAGTLVNPWGFRMYGAIAAQEHLSAQQANLVLETTPLYRDFFWSTLHPFTSLGAIWWMLAISVVALASLLLRKRFGLALFLALAISACLASARTQGVFLPIACLVAGAECEARARRLQRFSSLAWYMSAARLALLSLVMFVAWRSFEIVTDRAALEERQVTLFGTGASWWLPQRAAAFVEQQALPGQLFSSFNLGSYLTWRLGPRYKDFGDGRYLPFGDKLVSEQMRLASLPLDSEEWDKASARYGIRIVILPLSRFFGIEAVPLRADCENQKWVPVYLDSAAIVLVRRDALPAAKLSALRIDCQRQMLTRDGQTAGARMVRYERFANAAVIYFVLGRNQDAKAAMADARSIAGGDDSLMVLEGQIDETQGDPDAAEQAFRAALRMRESDAAWYQLGLVYAGQGRYAEATGALRQAARMEAQPSFAVQLSLAKTEVLNGEVDAALRLLERLSRDAPDGAAKAGLDDIETVAYSRQLNWPAAIAAEERAVQETPASARRWRTLAAMYAATGDRERSTQAMAQANALAE